MPITARYPSYLSRNQAAIEQVKAARDTDELQAAVMKWGVSADAIRKAVIKKMTELQRQSLSPNHPRIQSRVS